MLHTPKRMADLAEQIATRAETLAPQDEKLRALLSEMQELARVLPPETRERAGAEDDCEYEAMFNNMPI
ncbi:hypothetical protein [Halodurantibacterium flavum]|uniref:DUF2281 domain-containing protein n=1 Tax=Halodurantibacterium flavum TaxID=1382802 RepID=A0ABW4S7L0_9RHOB